MNWRSTSVLLPLLLVVPLAACSQQQAPPQAQETAASSSSLPDPSEQEVLDAPEQSGPALPDGVAQALSQDPSLSALADRSPERMRKADSYVLIDFPPVGDSEGVRVLLGPADPGLKVLDAGSAGVGCGILPASTLSDLGMLCL